MQLLATEKGDLPVKLRAAFAANALSARVALDEDRLPRLRETRLAIPALIVRGWRAPPAPIAGRHLIRRTPARGRAYLSTRCCPCVPTRKRGVGAAHCFRGPPTAIGTAHEARLVASEPRVSVLSLAVYLFCTNLGFAQERRAY